MAGFLLGAAALAEAARAADAPAGRVVVARGDVKAGARALKTGDSLSESETITTGPDSAAKLLMKDRTILDLGPDSKMRIDRYQAGGGQKRDVEMDLSKGTVRALVSKDASATAKNPTQFKIRSRSATMGVRGTEFVMASKEPPPGAPEGAGASTQITVIEGQVVAQKSGSGGQPAGGPVALSAGTRFTATESPPPTSAVAGGGAGAGPGAGAGGATSGVGGGSASAAGASGSGGSSSGGSANGSASASASGSGGGKGSSAAGGSGSASSAAASSSSGATGGAAGGGSVAAAAAAAATATSVGAGASGGPAAPAAAAPAGPEKVSSAELSSVASMATVSDNTFKLATVIEAAPASGGSSSSGSGGREPASGGPQGASGGSKGSGSSSGAGSSSGGGASGAGASSPVAAPAAGGIGATIVAVGNAGLSGGSGAAAPPPPPPPPANTSPLNLNVPGAPTGPTQFLPPPPPPLPDNVQVSIPL